MSLRHEFETSGRWLFLWRSYLPLLLVPLFVYPMAHFSYFGGNHAWDIGWDVACVLISLSGLAVRAITIGQTPAGTSGRNTHGQVAEVLNTSGMYSIVRHPLYLGNFLMWLGVAMFPHDFYFACAICLAFAVYYERIMFAEEAFLRGKFGAAFELWAKETPAIFPAIWKWRPSTLPFSWRNVLKREYSGLYALVVIFTLLEVSGEHSINSRFELETGWAIFLGCGSAIYLVLRTIRKHTRWLHQPGR